MATIYKRHRSPFFWIKYRNEQGRLVQESTSLRIDDAIQIRKAKQLLIEKKLIELKSGKVVGGPDRFENWVLAFLERRYHGSKKSFDRQRACWQNVEEYFKTLNIISPRQVTYDLAINYMNFRKGKAARNTAIAELKCLGMIMGEAVRRGFINTNPCTKLGLKRDDPEEKPEITYEQEAKIREELKHGDFRGDPWPHWMLIAFEIAIHQGCRLRETQIPWERIDLEGQAITFHAKGKKIFTPLLHPNLVPILRAEKEKGGKFTCELPALPSDWFRHLFNKLGMPDYCFHCTRVTVVSRQLRAGVAEPLIMKYVGHVSALINRLYQRIRLDDLSPCVRALSPNPLPQNQGSPSSTPKPSRTQ